MAATPPEKFDRYTLLHRIAEGRLAEVYIALDSEADAVDRLVVIKRVREEMQSTPEAARTFVDEENVLSRLSHPGIVRVRDFGRAKGRYFIALEQIWGETLLTLSRLCLQGHIPFPKHAALFVGARVARALHHAHTATDASGQPSPVIHRDVTLNNVLVSHLGEVKVLDFALAKAEGRVTQTFLGEIKGTEEYLAPEQLQQQPIGPFTDVYQLGVMLYKLLVGRRPFPDDTEGAYIRALLAGQIAKPSDIVEGFPSLIELVLLRALSREPGARFESALQMAEALEAILPDEWHAGEAQLVATFRGLVGDRHQRQVAYIEQVIKGLATDAQGGALLMRERGGVEPQRLHVELANLPRPPDL